MSLEAISPASTICRGRDVHKPSVTSAVLATSSRQRIYRRGPARSGSTTATTRCHSRLHRAGKQTSADVSLAHVRGYGQSETGLVSAMR
jgi:hypothetical protein